AAKEYGYKISEENLDTIPDTAPESVKKLKVWKVLSSRKSMIEKQWSPNIGSDGRLRGYCDPLGAVTNRMTHDNPNLANIPSLVKKKDENGVEKPLYGYDGLYSYEVRDCFTIKDKTNYVMFGTDASGLELRCLCHYMNDPVYTDIVVNGDPHEHNRKLAGLELRSQAKTFIYALLYGGGNAKLGTITGGSAQAGKALRERFMSSLPAFNDLVERVKKEA